LYERFAQNVHDAGAVLHTVEGAFGERDHSLIGIAPHETLCDRLQKNPTLDHQQHQYHQLRSSHELWQKEALINIGVARLPSSWKYVAWLDGDIQFLRPNWVGETIQLLQHYAFIQMFSHAQDLGPDYEVIASRDSFMSRALSQKTLPTGYYDSAATVQTAGWSGLAWACRRDAWDAVGGLIDFAIHGGGDWHMAFALLGQAENSIHKGVHPTYKRHILEWQERCERHIRRNVGCMTGTVAHFWHGDKRLRHYSDRHALLAKTQFNPDIDLKRDWQGLYQLVDHGTDRSLQLRDGLREYARLRNEDGVDFFGEKYLY
jgi:hypothetical protein